MSDVAALIADLVREGVSAELVGRVAAAIADAAVPAPALAEELTPRQARNRRYYERRASEKRLNASEQDDERLNSDGERLTASEIKTLKTPLARVEDNPLPVEITGKIGSEPKGSSPRVRATPPPLAKPNGFARFWEAYPSKVGKRDAEKAYGRALKRIDGPDPPAVILAGVERAKLSDRWREGFIPNPATFLNQDRWEDQPATRAQVHERPDHIADPAYDRRQANLQRAFDGFDAVAGRLERR